MAFKIGNYRSLNSFGTNHPHRSSLVKGQSLFKGYVRPHSLNQKYFYLSGRPTKQASNVFNPQIPAFILDHSTHKSNSDNHQAEALVSVASGELNPGITDSIYKISAAPSNKSGKGGKSKKPAESEPKEKDKSKDMTLEEMEKAIQDMGGRKIKNPVGTTDTRFVLNQSPEEQARHNNPLIGLGQNQVDIRNKAKAAWEITDKLFEAGSFNNIIRPGLMDPAIKMRLIEVEGGQGKTRYSFQLKISLTEGAATHLKAYLFRLTYDDKNEVLSADDIGFGSGDFMGTPYAFIQKGLTAKKLETMPAKEAFRLLAPHVGEFDDMLVEFVDYFKIPN